MFSTGLLSLRDAGSLNGNRGCPDGSEFERANEMKVMGCLLLIYLAAVARAMQGEMLSVVDFSAVAVVVAVRWCPPGVAASLAFVAGLLVDGFGAGPIGAQAAANVAAVAVLIRRGTPPQSWSPGRWMSAILLLVAANTAVMVLSQLGPFISGTDWERLAVSQSATALITAAFVGIIVRSGRLLWGVPCATR
jgi:hypothetical protein